MSRLKRILADAQAQEQLFGAPLEPPAKPDNRAERDETLRLNTRLRDEAIETAKRFPGELHLAELRSPFAVTWHFLVGAQPMTLCLKKSINTEHRFVRSYSSILSRTEVNCARCRAALGLPPLEELDVPF